MARTKKKPNIAALAKAKNAVRGSKNAFAAFDSARANLGLSDLQKFCKWFKQTSSAKPNIFVATTPSIYSELFNNWQLEHPSFRSARRWAAVEIKENAALIGIFVGHRDKFEACVTVGDYQSAQGVLDTIEEELGVSLWLMEQKVFILQRLSGIEEQKKFVDEIQGCLPERSLVAFFAHWFSQRNESDEFASNLIRRLVINIRGWQSSESLKAFIEYNLSFNFDGSDQALTGVLQMAATGSLVDLYESTIQTSQVALVQAEMDPDPDLLELIKFIQTDVQDWRLKNMDEASRTADGQSTTARNLYLNNQSKRLLSEGSPISQTLTCDDVAYLLSQGDVDLPTLLMEAHTLQLPLQHFIEAVDSSEDAPVEAMKVLGYIENTGKLSFSKVFKSHLEQHFIANNWDEKANHLAFLNLQSMSPYCLRYCPNVEVKASIFRHFMDVTGISNELYVEAVRSGVPLTAVNENNAPFPHTSSLESKLMDVDEALWRGDYEAAGPRASALLQSGTDFGIKWGSKSKAQKHLKLAEMTELAGFLVDRLVIHKNTDRGLPLNESAKQLTENQRKNLASSLLLPVLLDLHCKNCDGSMVDLRNYAYEDVLLLNDCLKPSELAEKWANQSDPLLTYYLSQVCINEVMQTSSEFLSSKALDEERLRVLSMLVKIDPKNSKEYEDETREIARSQLIQLGVREVGQSKIFVDLASIRRWAEKQLRPEFTRFQLLVDAGMAGDSAALKKALFQAIDTRTATADLLEIPKNEAAELLISIIRKIFTKCMSDPEHGLDCFLSMRIRHGTLSGQLRTPLEQQNMITRRDAETNDYQRNSYWEERLAHKVLPWEIEPLLEKLRLFSRTYDDFISHLSNDLIQVKSEVRPEGLLSATLMSHRFAVFYHELDQKSNFDDFLDRCFDLFYESLEGSLEKTRKHIHNQCKLDLVQMFRQLEADISTITVNEGVRELTRANRTASTNSLQSLDLVADWFRLPKTVDAQNFPLEVMIDVGSTCVTTIYQDFKPVVYKSVPELPPFADALTLFSDIFFIIFDNIRVHSGISPSPEVYIDVQDLGDHLRIKTTSQLSEEKEVDHVRKSIEISRTRIESGKYQDAIPTEGGTGLIKLWRTISRGSKVPRPLNFGLDDDEKFFVEIEISKREINL